MSLAILAALLVPLLGAALAVSVALEDWLRNNHKEDP